MKEGGSSMTDLFKAFRITLDIRKILLAFSGGLLAAGGAQAILLVVKRLAGQDLSLPGYGFHAVRRLGWELLHHPAAVPGEMLSRWATLMPDRRAALFLLYGIALPVWAWFVWAYFGGAICRIAALEFSQEDRIELKKALAYAGKHYRSFLWPPLAVAFIALAFFFGILAIGWIGRIWFVGKVVAGVLFPLALAAGLVIAVLIVGGVAGFPLMAPAVAVEGTDSFDAVSRAFNYFYNRPWRLLFSYVLAGIYGIVSVATVAIFATMAGSIAYAGLKAGMGGTAGILRDYVAGGVVLADLPSFSTQVAAVLVYAAVFLLKGAVCSYGVAYFFVAATLVYFSLRESVDGMSPDEIYEEKEVAATEPPAS
ncbi:MAG: hypothetical protein V1809_11235 [Planctomycetota bacterium]